MVATSRNAERLMRRSLSGGWIAFEVGDDPVAAGEQHVRQVIVAVIANAVARHALVAQRQQLLANFAFAVQHLGDVGLRTLAAARAARLRSSSKERFNCPSIP